MIHRFAYTTATAAPGASVTVRNEDAEAHTVTADGRGGFDVKADPNVDVTFRAPMTPGRYPFHCQYHAGMHGMLIVQ